MNISTERLILRPIQFEDKDQVFEYRSDSETNKYQGWIPETIKDVEEFIGKTSRQINEPDTWFQMVIIAQENEKIIGDMGLHFHGEENMQVEIGCTLNKHFHGKGFASEALSKVIDYLFDDLKKHRIVTSIDPENKSSLALVERLEFQQEAHFRKSLFIQGQWVDDVIYALLKPDWKSAEK